MHSKFSGLKALSWFGLIFAVIAMVIAVYLGGHHGSSASHLPGSANGQLSEAHGDGAAASDEDLAADDSVNDADAASDDVSATNASATAVAKIKSRTGTQLTPDSNILRPRKVEFVENQQGSQFTLYRFSDNSKLGSTSDRMARPALSLAKLFIAEYVLNNGTDADIELVESMITQSSDSAADQLWARYPESIDEVAEEYRLFSTRGGQRWGLSVTSTYDVVSFIAQLKDENPKHQLLEMMKHTEPIAADGYEQNFGTAQLPGVQGTKWGWSDDRSLHSSVSFGKDFVAAAAITGTAAELSAVVKEQFSDFVK